MTEHQNNNPEDLSTPKNPIELEGSVPANKSSALPKQRLRLLKIKNLGCIGDEPVDIEIDDIVVLVGPNNAGKSTVLRAYQLAMLEGSNDAKLKLEEFPEGKVTPGKFPEIEVHTVVGEQPPGKNWIDDTSGVPVVRERWTWETPGEKPRREGFDVIKQAWVKQVPWGAAGVANARRPQPRRIEAFSPPETEAKAILAILTKVLKQKVQEMPLHQQDDAGNDLTGEDGNKILTPYGHLMATYTLLHDSVVDQAQAEIRAVEDALSQFVENVFHGHKVSIDARPDESAFDFFKSGVDLKMGPMSGFQSLASQQGSGARRALMWAALRYIAENPPKKEKDELQRPNLLLLDEPELCQHPNAVRDACRVLYDLPSSGNWQVMITTHSPAFIDLSRDNTTIIRVSRSSTGKVETTTVFRPEKARLSEQDKEELKLLNAYDPHVAEFFFGGHNIIVEGDTEYSAFKYITSKFDLDPEFRNLHIIRARGKYTITLLAKILNAFGARYAVLHDSDKPTIQKKGKETVNPAWTNNDRILDQVKLATGDTRLVAMTPNFESVFFGEEAKNEKPYGALERLKTDHEAFAAATKLLRALINFDQPLPDNCIDWDSIEQLKEAHSRFSGG